MISDGSLPNEKRGLDTVFSATVSLHLWVGSERIELGQLGPGFAILRDAQSIAATTGEIETIVDEKVRRWPIRITSQITSESKRFTFEGISN